MNESDAILPSRAPLFDESALPSVAPAGIAAVPPSVAGMTEPISSGEDLPKDSPAVPSLEDRIARTTAAGGLTELPADFGDPHCGWETVRSANPFTVLFLDGRQAHRVTPEITSRHRGLLQRFWQEKLRSMSQGAARVSILHKYGGAEESERVIRGYPEAIERAYQKLATRDGIDSAYRTLVRERESQVLTRVDEKLDDYLVDFVLQPDELRALLAFAEREGIAPDTVLEHVQERLRVLGYVPEHEPAGETKESRLLSTAWMHPSALPTILPAPPAIARQRGVLLPLLAFSAVVVLVLVVAAALRSARVDHTQNPVTHLTATMAPQRETPPPVSPNHPSAERPPALSLPPVHTEPKAPAAPPLEHTANDRSAEHQRVLAEVASIREAIGSDPQAALMRVSELEKSIRSDDADARLAAAGVRSDIEKALLTKDLEAQKAAAEQAAAAAARAQRDREWQQRLAQVEELMRQPNYSGAKALADRIVAEPDVPPEIAKRARELGDQAVAELQKIFSKATVKSKTSRPSREQP